MKKFLILLSFFPLLTSAASFTSQSIFLSKDNVTEGDTVFIHSVISNTSTASFSGSLSLSDESTNLGTLPVSLKAGEGDLFSISWKPVAGTRRVRAEIITSEGILVATENASFTIKSKPLPNLPKTVTTIEPSDTIGQQVSNISPETGQALVPIFTLLDSGRTSAANVLDKGITWAKQQIDQKKTTGSVLGAETKNTTPTTSGILNTLWLVGSTIALYLLSILRAIVVNIGLFYPIFAILVFYLLWKGYKTVRRPRY